MYDWKCIIYKHIIRICTNYICIFINIIVIVRGLHKSPRNNKVLHIYSLDWFLCWIRSRIRTFLSSAKKRRKKNNRLYLCVWTTYLFAFANQVSMVSGGFAGFCPVGWFIYTFSIFGSVAQTVATTITDTRPGYTSLILYKPPRYSPPNSDIS